MSNSWSFPLKWVFLTVGIFLFLHSAVAFLQHFDPGVVGSFWDTCIDLLNRYIVRMDAPISLKPNGSGDTTWHWMHLLATALLAFAGGTLWAVLDRRRAHYAGLNFWLRFAYDMDSLGNLTLRGIPPTHDSLRIRLMKKKIPAFTLNSRGFHWVNEYPLNR